MVSAEQLRHGYPIKYEVPFNSTNKWQLVIVQSVGSVPEESDDIEYEVLMKGAPEVILGKCSTYGSTAARARHYREDMTDEFQQAFKKAYEGFAAQGRRVLALCSKTFKAPPDFEFNGEDNKFNFPTTELNFIAMVAIMDPPRDNVPDAISLCHRAGIRVFYGNGRSSAYGTCDF